MPSPLRFYRQETPYSCVPACLRMVLAALGCELSEAELRKHCDSTPFGTEALKAVDAMRFLGFSQTIKGTLTLPELIVQLELGHHPIVFVNLLPIESVKVAHAMVVIAVEAEMVKVSDPLEGERLLPRSTFETAWKMMRNLVILVQA